MRLPEPLQPVSKPHCRALPAALGVALATLLNAGAGATEAQIPGGCVEPVIAANATTLEREAKLVGYLLCLEEQASTTGKIEAALQSRAMANQSSAMRQSNPPSMMRSDRRGSLSRSADSMASDRTPPTMFR